MLTSATTASHSKDASVGYKSLRRANVDNTYGTQATADMEDPIVINVGGKKFETFTETLARFPDTLLGCQNRRERFYNNNRKEYFFDRHRSAFGAILYYYQSGGTLIRPDSVPPHVFFNEVTFYDLPEEALQSVQLEAGIVEEEEEKPLPTNKYMKWVWETLEYPEHSKLAKALAIISVVVISLSLIIFCIETLPAFNPVPTRPPTLSANDTDWQPEPNPYTKTWFMLNTLVIVWFTTEYVVRFICSPDKFRFLVGALNIIDLLSILPYYIQLALQEGSSSISVLRVVRVVRVFRVFKLSRHSRGLQILGNTLKASMNELLMLMFFLGIGVMIFASCVFYAEGGPGSDFPSIPHSFWWAVVTMTTVGYGDISPVSFSGKIVGALCAISGVLTIALPVPVIVSNFENFYNKELNRRKEEELKKAEEQRRLALEKSAAKEESMNMVNDSSKACSPERFYEYAVEMNNRGKSYTGDGDDPRNGKPV